MSDVLQVLGYLVAFRDFLSQWPSRVALSLWNLLIYLPVLSKKGREEI